MKTGRKADKKKIDRMRKEHMRKMKTGIVGSGMIVKEFLENLQGMEGLELAAICGTPRREAYLQELCRSYGIRKWYTDYDAMVTDPGVEVVYVAVPNHLHFEFCKKAVLAGKHVICEKPFTSNSRELEELGRLAIEEDYIAVVNQPHPCRHGDPQGCGIFWVFQIQLLVPGVPVYAVFLRALSAAFLYHGFLHSSPARPECSGHSYSSIFPFPKV